MNMLREKRLLVVVAKEPVAGQVKTRLSPKLTPEQAAALYHCMITDRLREIDQLNGIDLAIAFSPASARETFIPLACSRFDLFAQRGDSLGERQHNIFLDAFAADYSAVAIIDSDSPDLPKSIVEESFRLLLPPGADVVLGPCHDGGYYLIGMRQPHPDLFTDIPWSTPQVLAVTLDKTRKLGLKTALLSWQNDLDTFDDLIDFYKKCGDAQGMTTRCGENTFAFLSRLGKIINETPGKTPDHRTQQALLPSVQEEKHLSSWPSKA